MMRLLLLFLLLPCVAGADSLVATRTIRPQSILGPTDIAVTKDSSLPGVLADPAEALGREVRVALYAGRPIRADDLGPPAIIDRNQRVALSYVEGGLAITAEGRALGRGGVGDVIRVMNLSSRATVSGRIDPDGVVRVGPSP